MYNGIGLQTARGSGTNGHVQRNVAFVRPGKKDSVNYRTEDDLAKLDAQSNRQPNQGILDHERKRKVEVKCAELEEVLESQGLNLEEVRTKVELYRSKLMNQGTSTELPKDEFGRLLVRETHHIAQAQQEKNAKLREAFGISEYFVEGTSFDQDRKAKEDLAKADALQKELAEKERAGREADKANRKRYALVRTPSPDKLPTAAGNGKDGGGHDEDDDEAGGGRKDDKKKHRKKNRDGSSSPERKKDKKKKSKKNKKDRSKKKHSKRSHRDRDDSEAPSDSDSDSDRSESPSDGKHRKKSRKDKVRSEACW